jgi:hypothetical protein
VTIYTQAPVGALAPTMIMGQSSASRIAMATLLPFGVLLLGCRRKQHAGMRLVAALGVLFLSVGMMAGCSSSHLMIPATPTGASNVTITATSGSLTHTTKVALTVQ